MNSIKDKVIILTGASEGIGAVTARRLAAARGWQTAGFQSAIQR